jgi:hypothetical protein
MPGKKDRYVQRADQQRAVSSTQLSTTGHSPTRCPAGHRIESTVRYLGVEVDDALEIAEKIDV